VLLASDRKNGLRRVIRIAVGIIDRFAVPAFDRCDVQLVDRSDIDHD
jgi:hypothetical protein